MHHGDVNEVVGYVEVFEAAVFDGKRMEQRVQPRVTNEIPPYVQFEEVAIDVQEQVTDCIGAF